MLECLLMAMWRKKNAGGGAAAAAGVSDLGSAAPPCSCCGGGLDIADPRYNLSLPQPVLAMDDDEYERHVRFATDQIVVTDTIGGFARALLSVGLDDGRTTTIGVWVSVEHEVFQHIVAVGRGELPYDQMQFEGRLASEPAPWGRGLLGAAVSAGVDVPTDGRRPTPHIKQSSHELLTDVMARRWPAAEVLVGSMAWAQNYDPNAPVTPHRH